MKSRFISFLIIFAMLFGMVPNVGAVTAYGGTAEPTADDLALQAVRNLYDRYQDGTPVDGGYGNFDAYHGAVLVDAGVDLSTWERNDANLKVEMTALIDDSIASPSAMSSKRIAQDYLLAGKLEETAKASELLDVLKNRQTSYGAFDDDIYSDPIVFDILGDTGDLSQIDRESAVAYLTGEQLLDESHEEYGSWGADWGTWYSDFMATAQSIRTLHRLSPALGSISTGTAWMYGKTRDGVSVNSWDDPFIDTAEMLKTMTLMDSDWAGTTSEGAAAVDYLCMDGLNEDGSFGTSGNLADDVWALEAYLSLGAAVSADSVVEVSINEESIILDESEQQIFSIDVFLMDGAKILSLTPSSVDWSVDDTSKATIDANGVLSALDKGNVTVTATYGGASDSVEVFIYSLDDMALQAVRNIYGEYQNDVVIGNGFGNLNAYHGFVLIETGVDLLAWERNETTLKAELLELISTTSDVSAKGLAQNYLLADKLGETAKVAEILDALEAMQSEETGSFNDSITTDAPAFDILGQAGVYGGTTSLDLEAAASYLISGQQPEGDWQVLAWWADPAYYYSDFMSSAQSVRALKYMGKGAAAITSGKAWLDSCRQPDGTYVNGYDSTLTDTAEMLKTMLLLDADWVSNTSEGAGVLEYFAQEAMNTDGEFGQYPGLENDFSALEAYLSLGASIEGTSAIGMTIDADDSNIYEDGDTSTFTVTKHLLDGTTGSASAQDVAWTVDQSSKALIEDGVLTASEAGAVTVTAEMEGMTDSESVNIYSIDNLAMQAVQNIYDIYRGGTPVDGGYGNFDAYHGAVLVEAGVDLSTWERGEKNLLHEMNALTNGIEGKNSKRLAQDHQLTKMFGQNVTARALIVALSDMQEASSEGAFTDGDYSEYTNMPALDLIGKAGSIEEISMESAIDYMLAVQNTSTGAWAEDFQSTAQSVRALTIMAGASDYRNEEVAASLELSKGWLSGQEQEDGSFNIFSWGSWQDPVINTAEMIDAMGNEWQSSEHGQGAISYMVQDALNEDGTFGTSANLADDIWALETYLSLGAELDLGLSVSPTNSSVAENGSKQFVASVISLDKTEDVTASVEWSVSDTSKATIDPNGLLDAKNPGTVTVMASYNGLTDQTSITINSYEAPVERAYVTVKGYGNTILSKTSVTIGNGDSVLDVTRDILDDRGISYTASGGYVSEIGGIEEFDHGAQSGWMINVNGQVPGMSADSLDAENGDDIYWFYTSDWTEEEGSVVDDLEDPDDYAENLLEDGDATVEELTDAFDALLKEEGESGRETLLLLAKTAIKKAGEVSLEMDGNEPADMDASDLEALAEASAEQKAAMKEAFEDEGIALDKAFESRVVINVEGDGYLASVEFESGALGGAFDEGLDEVAVVTPWAEIALGADTLSSEDMDKEVVVEVRPTNESDLPEGADVPNGATVIDMNLFVGGDKTSNFNGTIKVSIPFEYDGDNEDALAVFWLKDDGTVVPVGGAYDSDLGMIVFETDHFSKYFVDESSVSFSDMEIAEWAEDQVAAMAGKGFINGRAPGRFDPSNDITRSEFAAIVTRMLSLEASNDYTAEFADVSDSDWFAGSVAAASEAGLMNGKGLGMFDPNGKITRQEQGLVLSNILKSYGYSEGEIKLDDEFNDAASIASWAEDGAACAVYHGLINGIDGRFAPIEKATRAQSAVMLCRLYFKIIK